jgi:hypothetical protein
MSGGDSRVRLTVLAVIASTRSASRTIAGSMAWPSRTGWRGAFQCLNALLQLPSAVRGDGL